jgi:nicotinamidase-related amidase
MELMLFLEDRGRSKESLWRLRPCQDLEAARSAPERIFYPQARLQRFVGTRLDLLLRYLDIKNLFTVGYSTDACLMTTVIDALWHDYKVILLCDCTLANDFPEEQAELLGTQRVVKMLESCTVYHPPGFICSQAFFTKT